MACFLVLTLFFLLHPLQATRKHSLQARKLQKCAESDEKERPQGTSSAATPGTTHNKLTTVSEWLDTVKAGYGDKFGVRCCLENGFKVRQTAS